MARSRSLGEEAARQTSRLRKKKFAIGSPIRCCETMWPEEILWDVYRVVCAVSNDEYGTERRRGEQGGSMYQVAADSVEWRKDWEGGEGRVGLGSSSGRRECSGLG